MTQNKVISILIISLVTSLTVLGVALTANKQLRTQSGQLTSINKELTDSLRGYKNKYGEEVVKRAAAEASTKLLVATYRDNFDWIKAHLGVQEKDVKGIFKAVTTIAGHGVGSSDTVTVITDGNPVVGLSVSDSTQWFKISGVAIPGKFTYNYTVFDKITLVPYKDGKNLFVKGLSENPNTSITGLQGILVATDPKNKRWGVGPSIQIGYDTQLRITPGISVQYSLIRF